MIWLITKKEDWEEPEVLGYSISFEEAKGWADRNHPSDHEWVEEERIDGSLEWSRRLTDHVWRVIITKVTEVSP